MSPKQALVSANTKVPRLVVQGVAATLEYLSCPLWIRWFVDAIARGMRQMRQWKAVLRPLSAGEAALFRQYVGNAPSSKLSRDYLFQRYEHVTNHESIHVNPIALIETLRWHNKTHDDQAARVFLHDCEHKGHVDTVKYLWEWLDSTITNMFFRDRMMRNGLSLAKRKQNLPEVSYLLTIVPNMSAMHVERLPVVAMKTGDEDYALAVWTPPPFATFHASLNEMTYGQRSYFNKNSVKGALIDSCNYDMRRVAVFLDEWWPHSVQKAGFIHFHAHPQPKHAMWWELSQRYKWDVAWPNVKVAYLVQSRLLPGLDHLGSHIATYLYVMDMQLEYDSAVESR
ncbi:hypothetical protein H257_14416 [Aphanomyces astaci]|uniref:Uncharacterized protein n=1 Tax=Aphanomyces astaci TaxID=112090 RepID=W4FTV7_APHAT|nr:hypothetical protein H257_14416 [Aphanomyces astaci]ETV70078.1 hypothetical protein H257_14416 [Aphanomyces astaci]|eukprot:XP_009840521.1 hypothetical protein H257_14416 [Aphanomyces astaci]